MIFRILVALLQIFVLLLIANAVLSWVTALARDWHPKGVVLVIVEGIYAVTEPPLKFLLRFIPPIRVGGFALEYTIAFLVLFLLVQFAIIALSSRI